MNGVAGELEERAVCRDFIYCVGVDPISVE